MKCIPDICPFWDTATLFTPVKVQQKERKLATNSQNMPKFHIFFCKKSTRLKKKSTPRPVVVVVTNISYDEMSAIMVTRYTLAKCSLYENYLLVSTWRKMLKRSRSYLVTRFPTSIENQHAFIFRAFFG